MGQMWSQPERGKQVLFKNSSKRLSSLLRKKKKAKIRTEIKVEKRQRKPQSKLGVILCRQKASLLKGRKNLLLTQMPQRKKVRRPKRTRHEKEE